MSSLLLISLVVGGAAVAAEQFDPAARAKTIAPFIDEQTFAVLHLDVSRVPVDKLVDLVGELIPDLEESEVSRVRQQMEMLRAAFTQAGGKEFYVVVSMADLPPGEGPFVVVPLSAGADEETLAKVWPDSRPDMRARIGNALVFADPRTLARVKRLKPVARPELTTALQVAGDTAAQAVLIPPKYTARVIEEMLPTLPPEVGDGASQVITKGLLWAAAGADITPEPSLKLVVQSQGNQAANALREKWVALLQFVGKEKEVREKVPAFDKFAALLTPEVQDDRLTITLDQENRGIAAVLSIVKPAIQDARRAAKRVVTASNLKQIGLAMHNYHDARKSFPAAASYDANGKPLLSWRVHILPYLEGQELYKQFHLDEPWDSQHNRKLIDQMPPVYRSPGSKLKEKGDRGERNLEGRASYVVVVGKDTVFPGREAMEDKLILGKRASHTVFGREAIPIQQIKDGTSSTIMAVEVDDEHAVIWTKPDDLPFDPDNPGKGLGGPDKRGFNVLFCDGSVRFLPKDIDLKVLRALFTRAGGELIPPGY